MNVIAIQNKGFQTISRWHKRFLEKIFKRAKIEQKW
jgi:hypothetical protein